MINGTLIFFPRFSDKKGVLAQRVFAGENGCCREIDDLKEKMRSTFRKLIGSETGFSLIELLIAVTLLLVALISMAVILTSGLRSSTNINVRMSARQLAESEMSRIKDMSFGTIGINGATNTFDVAQNGDQVKADTGTGIDASATAAGPLNITFTITRDVRKEVKNLPGNPATKLVTVTVSWQSSTPGGGGPINGGSEPLVSEIGPTNMATN